MKKILLSGLFAAFVTTTTFAQADATQQQLDQLRGKLQDIVEAQEAQGKRLDALTKEISELHDKVNAPKPTEDNASASDLKNLAEKLQEVDKKRAADRKLILDEIDKLAKIASGAPVKNKTTSTKPKSSDETTTPPTPQNGYYYEVKPGDTLPAIAKAYRDQGVKVTTAQIKAANPKMNPDVLIVGKKIFIPDANAK